jgi:hypothetical protein
MQCNVMLLQSHLSWELALNAFIASCCAERDAHPTIMKH